MAFFCLFLFFKETVHLGKNSLAKYKNTRLQEY